MVAKFIKHELYSIGRVAIIPAAVMVLFAVLARIMLETSEVGIMAIIFMFYFFSIMATLLVGFFFGISSFYQSLFTGNGYLTLSLPLSADKLILSKLLAAIIIFIASVIVCGMSSFIFLIGVEYNILQEIGNAFASMFEELTAIFGSADVALVAVESSLLSIISLPMSFLLFYAVMSIGQLFTVKNRKGVAIALYIGLIFTWSLLRELVIGHILNAMANVSIHLMMWVIIAFVAGVAVGCYFITRHIIKNKVNLLV